MNRHRSVGIGSIFKGDAKVEDGVYILCEESQESKQAQTNDVFSKKWNDYSQNDETEQEEFFLFQKEWYLTLYGFRSERDLRDAFKNVRLILDAGCGLGYKAAWFASLAPWAVVIGVDYSNAVFEAAKRYKDIDNLFFVKGDIADLKIKNCVFDYISCDQVIHHTEIPERTLKELNRVLVDGKELAVYVYAKKALPRELIDDYFRQHTKDYSHEEMKAFSQQLTELGKRLSELEVSFDSPEIPLLGIKGGRIDIQRFIYWNFLKCFWNDRLGKATSESCNYDWYAPSNAYRFTMKEFQLMLKKCGFEKAFLHTEEACHSGRFRKICVE